MGWITTAVILALCILLVTDTTVGASGAQKGSLETVTRSQASDHRLPPLSPSSLRSEHALLDKSRVALASSPKEHHNRLGQPFSEKVPRRSRTTREDTEALAVLVIFQLTSSHTNATFISELCPLINSTVTSLTVRGVYRMYWLLPSCVASSGTNMDKISVNSILVEDFRIFPSSISSLSLLESRVAPASTGATAGSGLDSGGNIAWNDLFSRFSSIASITMSYAGLKGSLPMQLPATLWRLDVSGNALTGSIPPTLYTLQSSSYALDIEFDASNNQLYGSIPPGLYTTFATATPITLAGSFSLILTGNRLTDSIPNNLFSPLERWQFVSFRVLLAANRLSGSISDLVFPSPVNPSLAFVAIDISGNLLNGTIASQFNFESMTQFYLDASYNGFGGDLPQRLFPNAWSAPGSDGTFEIYLSNNAFTGTIPSTLITGGLTASATTNSLVLALDNNQLTGTIPNELFYVTSTSGDPPIVIYPQFFTLRLGSNRLEGPLPANLLDYMSIPSYGPSIDLSGNLITGSIPESLLVNMISGSDYSEAIFNVASNQLSGSPPSTCWTSGSTQYDFSNNLLDGVIPAAWQDCSFGLIDLSYNPSLTSQMPSSLFNQVATFKAAYTPLQGPVPALDSTTLTELDLSGTNVDFCTASSAPSQLPTYCSLTSTSVCGCGYWYASCWTDCAPSELVSPGDMTSPTSMPETPLDSPITSPTTPHEAPLGSPISPPLASPSPPSINASCPNNTQPSDQFKCINGTWTATAVNTTTLVVQPGTGTIIVTGNLTSKAIVIKGVGSHIEVTGSAINLTSITIELTSQQVAAIGSNRVLQSLITVSSSDNTSSITGLSAVTVNTRVTDGCKRVKAQKSLWNGDRTLGAYLSVDNSGCNRWWIILVSVVAALVVIVVVVLIVLVAYFKPCRTHFRPYWARRRSANA